MKSLYHHDDHAEPHDLGLAHDLPALLDRRRALGLLTGAGLAAALAACSSERDDRSAGQHLECHRPGATVAVMKVWCG